MSGPSKLLLIAAPNEPSHTGTARFVYSRCLEDYNALMHVYIGSDHGGFALKAAIRQMLESEGITLTDLGTDSTDSVDYPQFAEAVGQAVSADPQGLGILLCRSGEGMEMAANKLPGIRAALVWNQPVAAETRRDNDANVLVLPGDFISEAQALACVRRFLATPFSGLDRHRRRLEELHALERQAYVPTV